MIQGSFWYCTVFSALFVSVILCLSTFLNYAFLNNVHVYSLIAVNFNYSILFEKDT